MKLLWLAIDIFSQAANLIYMNSSQYFSKELTLKK